MHVKCVKIFDIQSKYGLLVQTYFNKGTCKHDFSGSNYVVTEYDLKIYFSNKYCGFFSQKKVNQ